ncbi:MAG: pantoate--beta-alanine ligase [Bacteroidales bacterium]|jgi:pantoate--beta-alanine ligase|nr:pantoate--beta-alanine ligase [Bacteroidales bacterium]
MEIFYEIEPLKKRLAQLRAQGKSIGFVATMGALHLGHVSLVEKSNQDNDITAVSIFVNPTQFNNKEDLEKYPRNLEADIHLLEENEADIVFAPAVSEMYPQPDNRQFEIGAVAEVMEGKYRPGHFNGVCQVVSKLLNIMEPDNAYFGQKDYQQIAVIRTMVKKYMPDFKGKIISCPIKRESDGLALSSRNQHLSADQRVSALLISKTLFKAKEMSDKGATQKELVDYIKKSIATDANLCLEYVEIADKDTLQPIKGDLPKNAVICITVYDGKTRLIDNILL